jgi:IS5 family transposase
MLAVCILIFTAATNCQVPDEPKVCISQAAANKCAENARLVPALENKNTTLEASLLEKDKSIAELREAGRKNEADLKEALIKTQSELATKTGQLIGAEAMVTRLTAIIDFMLKNGREKCYGLICIQ